MKKIYGMILIILVVLVLTGCTTDVNKESSNNELVKTIDSTQQSGNSPVQSEVKYIGNETAEIDLSTFSSTMLFSELSRILSEYPTYIGKTIKINGLYSNMPYSDGSANLYHYVLVTDSTACCQQGLEFVIENGTEYPVMGDNTCVTGVLESYTENGQTYCHLVVK